MNVRFGVLLAAFALTVGAAVPASAGPITFTFEYPSATLMVGGTTYTGLPLTVTATGDTAGVYDDIFGHLYIDYDSLSFDVGGIVSGTFSDPGFVFVAGQTVGFTTFVHHDLAYIAGLPIVSYDLISNLGPLSGLAADPHQWADVPTSMGLTTLTFDSLGQPGTFTATVGGTNTVPDPGSSVLLFGIGLVTLKASRRLGQ